MGGTNATAAESRSTKENIELPMLLLEPSTIDEALPLRKEYEAAAAAYRRQSDPIVQRGSYAYLMGLLSRIRELAGWPEDYWAGCSPVHAPRI